MRSLTPRIVLELLAHEGLVREAYRDSQGVWTWSVGITDASGHRVFPRYKDNPQPVSRCLEVYVWLLRTRYLPPVVEAFGRYDPAEHELGAALSFHWNTGAIRRASWVPKFLGKEREAARTAFLSWNRPTAVMARRKREAALLFDGKWSNDGTAPVYDVAKPDYRPVRPQVQNLAATVARLLDPALPEHDAGRRAPVEKAPAIAAGIEPATPVNWFRRLLGWA